MSDPNVVLTAPDTTGLPDIAEASFGPLRPGMNPLDDPIVEAPPAPEVVFGTDDRIQILNTADYPWRVHADLRITAANGTLWSGTGWFIGPHTLATAGHVVFIYRPGTTLHGWVRSIQVMPGRNSSTLPYGSVTSTDFRSVGGWTQSGDENYDYGALRIPTELGNTVGWFSFGVYADSDLLATTANIAGYPGDKPAGTQWYHWRQVASVNSRKVYYTIATDPGQSGSSVYRLIGGGRYGIAIHAYGGCNGEQRHAHRATSLRQLGRLEGLDTAIQPEVLQWPTPAGAGSPVWQERSLGQCSVHRIPSAVCGMKEA